jgi:acetoin utilization deacetylase AcuC-like enzyme
MGVGLRRRLVTVGTSSARARLIDVNLKVPVVWSEDCLRHEPGGGVWLGVRDQADEVPARALVLRDALAAAGAPVVPAEPHGDEIVRIVHDPALVDHLAGIWRSWVAAGFPAEHGRDRVVPYVFPTDGLLAGLPLRSPPAVHGRAGRFCYDTMTLIGPGSWEAIRGAADAALTAAGLVSSGEPVAYALCRPPGHHVTRSSYGGSCYLNNAAIAAQALLAGGARRVAIIDIDAHHGNGTQMIFYERADVWYGSLHVDPGRAGSRTTPVMPKNAGAARARASTATFRWRREPATTAGSPPWTPCAARRARWSPTPWCCRWGWTPRPPTRRARWRSPRPATGPPAGGSPPWRRRC